MTAIIEDLIGVNIVYALCALRQVVEALVDPGIALGGFALAMYSSTRSPSMASDATLATPQASCLLLFNGRRSEMEEADDRDAGGDDQHGQRHQHDDL